jgi:hypothetical protein
MEITMSMLKENPGKYAELAQTVDITVTKYGEIVLGLINKDSLARLKRQQAADRLIGSVTFPPEYDDPNYDPDYDKLREGKGEV